MTRKYLPGFAGVLSISTLFFFALTPPTLSASPSFLRIWGGPGADSLAGMVSEENGSFLLTGQTNSFGVGTFGGFLIRYGSNGSLLMQEAWYETQNDSFPLEITEYEDGGILVAGYRAPRSSNSCFPWGSFGDCDAFLMKLSPMGNILWQVGFGTNGSDLAKGLGIDSAGDIYVAGYVNTVVGSYLTADDAFLAKFNSSGSLQWVKMWGTPFGDDHANRLLVDPSGYVYVTGYTKASSDPNGDAFLFKFDINGSLVWQRTWGGANYDEGFGLAAGANGDVYLSGRTRSLKQPVYSSAYDAMLLKFTANGSLVWQRVWGNATNVNVGNRISLADSGDIYVTGRTGADIANMNTWDLLFLRYDSDANLLSQTAWGSRSGLEDGQAIFVDSSGNVFIGGALSTPPPYGSLDPESSSIQTFYLALDPSIVLETRSFDVSLMNATVQTTNVTQTYSGQYDIYFSANLPTGSGAQVMLFPTSAAGFAMIVAAVVVLFLARRRMDGRT